MVKGLRPPFRLAKFEGDAVFVYAVTEKIDGSLIQDAIESAYFGFRKRLRNIKQSTTCECNACRRMGTLDLKFVTHHGEFIKQRMGGRQELAGRDVILVHRLLTALSPKVKALIGLAPTWRPRKPLVGGFVARGPSKQSRRVCAPPGVVDAVVSAGRATRGARTTPMLKLGCILQGFH
ncbi:MAG: DUF2652 domain-containing protein [Bauldia sp.]